ncbi:protein shisa-4-like [Melanotaenia boesemani]|uniref:protein shisa-4-like n=1 Tax=Melanotaenia boesemani TaxID=1250792 RepID=UPI001C04E83F|nr:protein shisa-4-like [Melanotaenia boesemani]
MALGLSCVFVLVLCATLFPSVSAGDQDCKSYTDSFGVYHSSEKCRTGFCCGSCNYRQCCWDYSRWFTEDQQEKCQSYSFSYNSRVPMIVGIVCSIVAFLIFICCCVCPCCCLYKMCRKPQPVIASTTHTTVVTTNTQQYPQQPTAIPGLPQSYQAAQYPPYQPMPVQPGYGTQPMPTSHYPGQQFMPGPPPTYQEATGPTYPPQPMPYSQAAYAPGQPTYPLQPPAKLQPSTAPPAQRDYLTQPAYNPDYVAPPTTG